MGSYTGALRFNRRAKVKEWSSKVGFLGYFVWGLIMGKSKNTVKVIGVGVLGGQVINLLLRSDFGSVAEQAVYIDQELLIDCAAGNIYFLKKDKVEWWGFIAKIKSLKKYVWPGDKYLARVLKGANLVILIIGYRGESEVLRWSQVVLETSAKMGITLIVVATLPFRFEGKLHQKIAKKTAQELKQYTKWLILFPLDRLLIEYPKEPSLSGLLQKARDKMEGIVEEILGQISIIEDNRDQAALRKALMKMDGRFKEFDGKWGEIPSKELLERQLIGQKPVFFFDEEE